MVKMDEKMLVNQRMLCLLISLAFGSEDDYTGGQEKGGLLINLGRTCLVLHDDAEDG